MATGIGKVRVVAVTQSVQLSKSQNQKKLAAPPPNSVPIVAKTEMKDCAALYLVPVVVDQNGRYAPCDPNAYGTRIDGSAVASQSGGPDLSWSGNLVFPQQCTGVALLFLVYHDQTFHSAELKLEGEAKGALAKLFSTKLAGQKPLAQATHWSAAAVNPQATPAQEHAAIQEAFSEPEQTRLKCAVWLRV